MVNKESIAILLDSAPPTWTSQEDRHLLLAERLIDKGIQPVLIFSAPLKKEYQKRFDDVGAIVRSLGYDGRPWSFYRGLKQIFREYDVKIAHIIFFDYFSLVPWIVRATGLKRIVYEMQNSGIFRATSWKRFLLRCRTKITTAPVVKFIAISEFVKIQLIAAGVNEGLISVRYLGVDTERFKPDPLAGKAWREKFNLRPTDVILSSVSYLRPFKNPDILVRACQELKSRDVNFRLFVAGDGDMLPDLKSLSKELGVDDHIHWLGNVADPRNLLQASDIFLLASTGEAFGLVLAEAMACGVPIVGSDSGSVPEVIEPRKSGQLFTPRMHTELAEAVEELSIDNKLRRNMAQAAIERARGLFTTEIAVRKTIEIYDELSGS